MKRWNRDGFYPYAPKQPPPEHGIKMKKAGTTWWGQRWIEALEAVLRGDAGRLARGRTYARAGRAHDLHVKDGKVRAKVTGSRSEPYTIAIELVQLSESVWSAAIAGMAQKAQFSAELLAGRMPAEIDEVFRAAEVSLFPTRRDDLVTSCSCPDWGDPCKHVAATHYVLGEALDRDPFLLFELRGKEKDQVLAALRAARREPEKAGKKQRATKQENPVASASPAPAHEIPSVKLKKLVASDYDTPRAELPALHFCFDEPATHGAVLRQLGVPSGWSDETSPAEVLAPLVRAAAETARAIALADAKSEPEAAQATSSPPAALPSSSAVGGRRSGPQSNARRARPRTRASRR